MITLNNFLTHWIKIYLNDLQTVPHKLVNIYRYSVATLKHMLKSALKTYKETLPYSKKSSFTRQ